LYRITLPILLYAPAVYAMGGDLFGGGGGEGGGEEQGGFGSFSFLIPLVLVMVVFYFLMIRPQQKREKERRAMLASVKKGDKVFTAGGIRGTVVKIYDKEKIVRVEIAKGVEVDVALPKIEAALDPADIAARQRDGQTGQTGEKEKKSFLSGLFGG
jgi:preprotein translocase subunit YajC